jgi:type VI secretion system protein ImpH
MAHEKWRAVRDLIRQLRSPERQADFFQLVRLLERSRQGPALRPPQGRPLRPAGASRHPEEEAVRFRAAVAARFLPASTVPLSADARSEDAGRAEVETTFMSAAGAQGVLPQHYTTLLLQRLREGDTALKDFLDLFHHRLIAALVRGWQKYRPFAAHEAAGAAGEQDEFTRALLGLDGRSSFDDDSGFDQRIILYYSGAFSDRRRAATSLAAVLQDLFATRVDIEQFHPQRTTLRPEHQWRLPVGRTSTGITARLGQGMLLGTSVLIVQTSFRVRVGPLSAEEFREHLPGGARFDVLNRLVRYYVGFEFVFEVQLALRGPAVPEFRLGRGEHGLRLGWETWLPRGRSEDEVVDDVSFVVTN